MTENKWQGLEKMVEGLKKDLGKDLKWSWDERFKAALAEFPSGDKDRILGLAKPSFDSLWDSANIPSASPRIAKVCKNYGGLRAGQLLLATDPGKDILVLGAWWPWGNQKTISLRIIPVDSDTPTPGFDEFMRLFKTWFGL